MSEVASRTALSASRITRIADDLARAGLVVKTRYNADGRGNLTTLTEAGMDRRCAAQVPHLRRVRTRYLDGLPPEDIPIAAKLLARMLDNLQRSLDEHRDVDGTRSRP